MDGSDHHHHRSSSGNNGGSRWNPTKDQISLLEGLYRQGLRTPTAEQIQQITDRLKAYGHIEGKNVFYWFQNHKARQRQKQKQKQQINFGYYKQYRLPHRYPPPHPLFFPPHPNVAYIPNDHLGLYHHQFPKVQIPAASQQQPTTLRYYKPMHEYPRTQNDEEQPNISHNQETLDLFPIHPTGVLQTRNGIHEDDDKNPNSAEDYENDDCTGTDDHDRGHHQAFFDFFCKN